jgi:outer membrane receptor for ferrienterochelin and colicins
MKIRAFLTGCAAFACLHAAGQNIQFLNGNNEAVISAHIALMPLDKSTKAVDLMTDVDGIASFPASLTHYPYIMTASALGYKQVTDTLYSFKNKICHLAQQAQVINEVIVTGQYAPNSEDNAVQKVEVIDRQKMDAMGAQNLRDVLTNELNVSLAQDPILG